MKHQDNRWWDEHSKKRRRGDKKLLVPVVKELPPAQPTVKRLFVSPDFTDPEFLRRVGRIASKYTFQNYRYPMSVDVREDYKDTVMVSLKFQCDNRDTGEPIQIYSNFIVYGSMTDEDIRSRVRHAIREFVLHEMQECLFYDGVREQDPHKNDYPVYTGRVLL